MNRRSFFQSISRAAAIIALAPQIAFRAPKLKWEDDAWFRTELDMKACGIPRYNLYDLVMDRVKKDKFDAHYRKEALRFLTS